jgi:serine/threonine protein kinase
LSGAPPDPIASEVDPLIGRSIGGKFVIERLLGAGAMGAVYRASQTALERTVAIKVMHGEIAFDPTFAARFHREAKAVSRIDHPNLIRVLDYGQEADGLLYIAMEFLDGRDLFQVIEEEWPLPHDRIVDIVSQVLSALAEAHDAGVLHRDLKPENIMLLRRKSEDGAPIDVVKVCDFGIAKIQEPEARPAPARGGRNLTAAGLVVGTPGYMSPEQARSEPCDARSDLYSVGVILYQLLSRRLPYEGSTPLDVVVRSLHEPPPPLGTHGPTAAPGLEPLCMKAMSKRPEERYPSAREMRAALRAAIPVPRQVVISSSEQRPSIVNAPTQVELVTNAPPVGASASEAPTGRPNTLVRVTAVVGVVAVGAVAALLMLRHGSSSSPSPPVGSSAPGAILAEPRSPSAAPSVLAPVVAPVLTPTSQPAPSSASPPVETAHAPGPSPPAPSSVARANRRNGHEARELQGAQETLAFAPQPSPVPPMPPGTPSGPPSSVVVAAPVAPPASPSAAPPPVAPAPAPPAPPTFNLATARVEIGPPRSNNAAATGSTIGRAINPFGARFTDCYRAALAQSESASPALATLHLESDDQGYVTTARVAGTVPALAARCIERLMTRSVRIEVDTGTANADVPLTFKPL